jgi:hypothetical protein
MLIKTRFYLPEILFGFLLAVVIITIGMTFWSSPTRQERANEQQQTFEATPAKENVNQGFWEKTTDDPVAYFTVWLVGFTGVLAFVSIFQGVMLLRADKTTRDLFSADQRPWINLSNPKIRVSDDKSAMRFTVGAKNIGKTPAFAVEVRAKAFKCKLPSPNIESVKEFARTLNAPSKWKNFRRAIFPDADAVLRAFDNLEIDTGKGGDFVRTTYCVTYFANGDPKIYRTAGEVIFSFKSIDSTDNIEGDWFAVSGFVNNVGVTYAD